MQVEPVVLLRRQREQRLLECALYRTEHIAARPLFFGSPLVSDDIREARFERRKLVDQARQRRIMNDAKPRPRCQVEIRGIDNALDIAARPRHACERLEFGQIAEDARSRSIKRHRVIRRVSVQVQLRIHVALRRQYAVQLVQQATFELARLDLEFRARRSIDDANRYTGMANAVAQLGGEVPLDLLAAEVLDARQDALDQHLGARVGEERRPLRDAKGWVTLAQVHLVRATVGAGRGQEKVFAQRPETQQADTEFALQPTGAVRLQLPLD